MIVPYTDKGKMVELESGLIVPGYAVPKSQPKGFDFFAGCGGFSLGMHQAGIHVVGAMEWDYNASQTYLCNLAQYGNLKMHFDTPEREEGFEKYLQKQFSKKGLVTMPVAGSGWISQHPEAKGCEHFWIADIRNITGEMILKELGMKRGELDVVCGGPPCQGFSSAGKREVGDPRNNLVFEYARMIVELNPKTFVMENVPGILTMTTEDGVPIMDQFCRIIADGEYAPYESVCKMMGTKPRSRKVMRQECDPKAARQRPKDRSTEKAKRPLASAAVVSPQPSAQASLF